MLLVKPSPLDRPNVSPKGSRKQRQKVRVSTGAIDYRAAAMSEPGFQSLFLRAHQPPSATQFEDSLPATALIVLLTAVPTSAPIRAAAEYQPVELALPPNAPCSPNRYPEAVGCACKEKLRVRRSWRIYSPDLAS